MFQPNVMGFSTDVILFRKELVKASTNLRTTSVSDVKLSKDTNSSKYVEDSLQLAMLSLSIIDSITQLVSRAGVPDDDPFLPHSSFSSHPINSCKHGLVA